MTIRNNRNVLAFGQGGEELQEKLKNFKVAVIGSDLLSQNVLAGVVGLGVGHIYFMDNERINNTKKDFLCLHEEMDIGKKKTVKMQDTLGRINESLLSNDQEVVGIHAKFSETLLYRYRPEVIIDATNNSFSKKKSLKYALMYKVPFISAVSDNTKTIVSFFDPKNKNSKRFNQNPDLETLILPDFDNKDQGTFTSSIAGGIICEELRKLNFKYTKDGTDDNIKNNENVIYNLSSKSRVKLDDCLRERMPLFFKNKKALVMGGGGIGNFVTLNLALLGIGDIDIIDLDFVEDHNLNRQILLYGGVGDKKVDVLKKRINEIDPFIKCRGIYGKIGQVDLRKDEPWLRELYEIDKKLWGAEKNEGTWNNFPSFEKFVSIYYNKNEKDPKDITILNKKDLSKKKYDVIFGCSDNKYARLWLNKYAIDKKIPYIDGGTGPRGGQMATYIPNETKCIDCQLGIKNFRRNNMSCADQSEGSVVMSNMIIGGIMVGESIRAMYNMGDPILNGLKYKALSVQKVGKNREKNILAIR